MQYKINKLNVNLSTMIKNSWENVVLYTLYALSEHNVSTLQMY